MLELFRACPSCKQHLNADAGHCEACGQIVGREPVSRTRRFLTVAALVALAVGGFGFLVQQEVGPWVKHFAPKVRAPAAASAWAYPIPEPAARVWAFPLEKSLDEVCAGLWVSFADPKYLEPTLNFQLLGGNLAAAKQTYHRAKLTHTAVPRLLPEELQDALAAIGTREAFVGRCLTQSYARVVPCEQHRARLTSPEAAACFTAPVQQMLGSFSFRTCAELAHAGRVKNLCTVAAERTEAYQAYQAQQAAQPPVAQTGM